MKGNNIFTTKIISFVLVMLVVGISMFAFLSSDIFNLMWLRHVYGNTYPLDKQGRCLVVELDNKNSQNPDLKFYDTERREFLHLDLFQDIKKISEIRPGYYALFDRHGIQIYSIVMPYASQDLHVRMSDEIQIIECYDSDRYKFDYDSEGPKLSDDFGVAERQIIEHYDELGYCSRLLLNYVWEHPNSLKYDFDNIKENTDIGILTSDDRKLRFFSWDTGGGGTSPDYMTYVQYDNGSEIQLCSFRPLAQSKYVCQTDVEKDGYEPYESAWVNLVHQIDSPDGNTLYITSSYNKASSREGEQDANLLQIVNGKLQKIPFIDKDGNQILSVGCYYYIPDWYFLTDGLGWKWIMSFDKENYIFYVPEDGDMIMTDRYDKYQFVNGQMKYVGNGAGFWLHPSLREFKRLCGIYQTHTKLIRIDVLENGEYRYASWHKNNAMSGEPELVLIGAKTDEIENALVFEKNDYQYIVPAYRNGEGEDFGKFIIKKDGKIVQETDV